MRQDKHRRRFRLYKWDVQFFTLDFHGIANSEHKSAKLRLSWSLPLLRYLTWSGLDIWFVLWRSFCKRMVREVQQCYFVPVICLCSKNVLCPMHARLSIRFIRKAIEQTKSSISEALSFRIEEDSAFMLGIRCSFSSKSSAKYWTFHPKKREDS